MFKEIDGEDTSLRFKSVLLSKFRYLTKYFAQIYRTIYGAAILVYLRGTPGGHQPWRPENSVKNWNLLWLSRQLFICTE